MRQIAEGLRKRFSDGQIFRNLSFEVNLCDVVTSVGVRGALRSPGITTAETDS